MVGAHSSSFRTTPGADIYWYFSDPVYYRDYDPFMLVQTGSSALQLWIWLAVGDADPWRERVEQFHQLLVSRGIPHRFSSGNGIHEGSYWSARMVEYLPFYGDALVNPVAAPGAPEIEPVFAPLGAGLD